MFCERTKEYLSEKGVTFTDRDITRDPEALDELKRLGAMTTPVTLIGSRVVIGFDTDKIDSALAQPGGTR
jgi:glutaredoxin